MVRVTAETNSGYWRDSEDSAAFTIYPNTPNRPVITDLQVANNGQVTVRWTAYEGARDYTIRILSADKLEQLEIIYHIKATEYTHELSSGTYVIRVTAEMRDGTWRNSEDSSQFTISPNVPEKPVITDVQAANNGKATVKWTACAGARDYTLRIFSTDKAEPIATIWGINATEYTHELPNGTYVVRVTAETNSGYWRDSEDSAAFTISPNVLEKPVVTDVKVENNAKVTVKWTACEGARDYTLRIFSTDKAEPIATIWGINATEYTHELSSGTYVVRVTAEMGDGTWRDSEDSDAFTVSTDNLESAYVVDTHGGFLRGVDENTSLKTLLENLADSTDITVTNLNGNEMEVGDLIGTGYTVSKFDQNGNLIYVVRVVVLGDTTGDAKVNSRDIAALQKHVLGNFKLDSAFFTASDLNNDGNTNSRDIAQLQRQVVN